MTVATAGPSEKAAPPRRAAIDSPTLRKDRWWAQPLVTATVLVAFIAYSTWAAFQNANYYVRPYLSPFYSPCLAARCGYARAGSTITHPPMVGLFGPWWVISPAIIVLVVPLGFRLTCYYYRKAYYRSLLLSPPACAVREPRRRYTGESRLPLILQNAHRWFFYLGLLFNGILTWDAIEAFHWPNGWGHMGFGTLMLVLNAIFLWSYSLSCHSCRHVSGRPAQALLPPPAAVQVMGLCFQAEHQAHADRMGEPGFRGANRPLYPAGCGWLGPRPEVFLKCHPKKHSNTIPMTSS